MDPQLGLMVAAIFAAAIATSVAPQASAQQEGGEKSIPGAKLIHLERFVPTSVDQKVLFVTAVTPDCAPIGTFTPKIVAKPQHGVLTFTDAEDYSVWNAPNVREKCNDKKVRGLRVSYKSDPDYTGKDAVTLLIISPESVAFQYELSIDVR